MVDFNKKLDEALEDAKRDKKPTIHYTTQTLESDRPLAICGIRTTAASSTENPQAVTCGRCLNKLKKNPDTGTKKVADTNEAEAPIQIMSDGVEIDTATTVEEATAKAQDFSDSMGGIEIEVVQGGAILYTIGGEQEEEEKPVGKPKKQAKVTDIKEGKDKAAAKKATAPAKKETPAKAPKEKGDCVCGCGTKTGGTFAPGHDGRVHGWMKQVAAGTKKLKELPESAQKYIKAHTA